MTQRRVELRCRWHLHGVLMVQQEPPSTPINNTVEFECSRCSKRCGHPVTHVWDAVTGAKLENKGEKIAQAA